jgi:hypothetical protein
VVSNAGEGGEVPKRPWLAVLLAVIYPGLGHLYLREWIRAILWFGLIVSATSLLLPADAVPSALTLEAVIEATSSIPLRVSLAIVALTVLSVFDAYWLARRAETEAAAAAVGGRDGTQSCPNCGKELDEDLEFCHWCTEPLSGASDAEERAGGV